MVKTTKAQRKRVFEIYNRTVTGKTYRQFRKTVQPTFGCDSAVVVEWCGMFVCVETDGYAHT